MKYSNLIFFLLSFFGLILNVQANITETFNKKVGENYEKIIGLYPFQNMNNDIGIFYDFTWSGKSKKIVIKRDSQNFPVIRFSLFNKEIKKGIAVHKYNEIDLSKTTDEEIKRLHKQNREAKLTLKNNKSIFLQPNKYDYNDIKLSNFYLEYINNIDTNKGLLEISFTANFTNKRPELNSLAADILGDEIYEVDLSYGYFPILDVAINEYKYDVDIRKGIKSTDWEGIFYSYDNNEVKTVREESGIGQFRQNFDFKKFPFDKQKLKIQIKNQANSSSNKLEVWPNTGRGAVHFISPDPGAFLGLEEYLNNVSGNYLKEWTVKKTNIISEEILTENWFNEYSGKTHPYYVNSISLVLDIERNSAHYIYKIIIPVFLILSVAWFVLWIPTHHLESRLTTSIVALLALIAYNFVFSDDIPKINYLTALDKYILLSYIFCCIPTFMSIGFSRFMVKNQRMVTTINKKLRTWLGLIYLVSTIQIFSF